MAGVWARIIVLGLAVCSCYDHGHAQQQDLAQPPVLPTLSPPLPPRWIVFPEPPPLPSPPDAPIPDLGNAAGSARQVQVGSKTRTRPSDA